MAQYNNYHKYSNFQYVQEELLRRKEAHMKWAKVLKGYLGSHKAKLLEIGCSNGILLKHFSEYGYDCYGIEIDPSSAQIAQKFVGADRIFIGLSNESPFLDGTFDLVISEQVIEHMANPFELLLYANKALKKNGILFLSTPNFGGFSFKLLKDEWKNAIPNTHISMFTPQALFFYLRKAGFKPLAKRIAGCTFHMRRNASGEFARYQGWLSLACLRLLRIVLRLLKLGDNIIVISLKL